MVADLPERSDAELVRAARDDDPTAFGELFERWFDRVYDVARNIVRNDDTAAEIAQDVFLTTWQRLGQLDDPERFGGWLLRAGRNRALNRLEKDRRSQPIDGDVVTGLHESQHGNAGDRDDVVGSNRLLETEAISDARSQQSLVWAAAAALGPRDASLLDLQLRHQLSPAEIADELDLTANNAHQLLFRLRSKLGDAIANHLLWRDGSPRCDELAALVDGDPFDAATNKVVQRHSARCDECGPERERVVDPTKLFAAAPIAIAPVFLRDRAASALADAGVPVTPSGQTAPAEPSVAGDHDNAGRHDHEDTGGGDEGGPVEPTDALSGPAQRRQRGRAVALAAVVVTTAAVVIGLMTRPAGEVDLAVEADPTSTDPVADVTPETDPPLALPTTTQTTVPSTTVPSTTVPSTTVPSTTVPSTTVPSTTVPTTAPTTPQTTPSTPPTTEPPPPPPVEPAPVIVRFSLRVPDGAIFCPTPSDTARTANWFTEEATQVTLTTPNGTTPFDPSASHTFCAPTGSVITLTATGPGGSVTDTETIS